MSSYPATLAAAWAEHIAPRAADAPTVISTFAGCGGSSLGYSMAGFRELLAVEWDDNAVATFALNFPEVPIYHGDIAALSVADVLARTGLKPGELDVFDGSPPCQGFSTAGKRNMDDSRSQLFREYVRLLEGLQPRVFVMENVSGMVKGKMKLVFVEILKALKACGYQVSVRLLNAMYFNVPQSRGRTIFVGVRGDISVLASHPLAQSHPLAMASVLPISAARYDTKGQFAKITYDPKCDVFPTITKGNQYHLLVLMQGETKKRQLSTGEVQIIGSFPPPFQFAGSRGNAWERIGNSVPPLFMRAIARHVRTEILEKAVRQKAVRS